MSTITQTIKHAKRCYKKQLKINFYLILFYELEIFKGVHCWHIYPILEYFKVSDRKGSQVIFFLKSFEDPHDHINYTLMKSAV